MSINEYIKLIFNMENTNETHILVNKELLEQLKDFEIWKKWKHGEFSLVEESDEDHALDMALNKMVE